MPSPRATNTKTSASRSKRTTSASATTTSSSSKSRSSTKASAPTKKAVSSPAKPAVTKAPAAKAKPTKPVVSVSLIDGPSAASKKTPTPATAAPTAAPQAEEKKPIAAPTPVAPKRSIGLPPISRIKHSLAVSAAAAEKAAAAAKSLPKPTPPRPAVVDLITSSRPSRSSGKAPAAPVEETPPAAPEAIPAAATTDSDDEKVIHLKPPIVAKDLAAALNLKQHIINRDLIPMGIFANPMTILEPDTVSALCKKYGYEFAAEKREKGAGVHKPEPVVAPPAEPEKPKEEELIARAPIITFMGHVDHGKTSLMDAIRKSRVASGEAGGITQHIGAYSVSYQGKTITFLDTPGHAAFTAMRARGANVTDIVVLVVAADDGIMPQTKEAISHAKAAGVTIMVAINKVDLPGANIDRVKQQLTENDLSPDDWGGDTTCVEVSATKGTGIDTLLELMTTQSELMELKASNKAAMRGTVIEAQVEPGRGPTATILVRMGTLHAGDAFICGRYYGKVKAMFNDMGKPIRQAGPSTPVKVLGFSGLPDAGDELLVMDNERSAKALSEERLQEVRTQKLTAPTRPTLETLFARANGTQKKALRLVIKADVQGSLEAILASLRDIKTNKVDLEFIHSAVGPISDNDVLLASASNAVIIGFNVKVENVAVSSAKREGVQIKLYSIIYELIDQVREAMTGLLDPELRETIIGHAEVKKVFETSKGVVAGCLVADGRAVRTARARVLRRRQAVYDGAVNTLRRFQDDVKEVRAGTDCGIKLGDYNEYQEGDIIEFYSLEKVAQKL